MVNGAIDPSPKASDLPPQIIERFNGARPDFLVATRDDLDRIGIVLAHDQLARFQKGKPILIAAGRVEHCEALNRGLTAEFTPLQAGLLHKIIDSAVDVMFSWKPPATATEEIALRLMDLAFDVDDPMSWIINLRTVSEGDRCWTAHPADPASTDTAAPLRAAVPDIAVAAMCR